jgi:hypothetical protein
VSRTRQARFADLVALTVLAWFEGAPYDQITYTVTTQVISFSKVERDTYHTLAVVCSVVIDCDDQTHAGPILC